MRRWTILLAVVWMLLGSFYPYNKVEKPMQTTIYKVIGVKDGDTVELLINGKGEVVRLAHIDAPEKAQPFGKRAKQFVSEHCFGKMVSIIPQKKPDRYGRIIAEIILPDGSNLNKELVKNGLAWHFKKYSNSKEYASLEVEAKARKIGLWSDPYAMPPWEWRKPKIRNENLARMKEERFLEMKN